MIALVLVAIAAVRIAQSRTPLVTRINYSELYQIAETGAAASLVIEGDALTVQTTQGTALQATVTSEVVRQGLVDQFRKNNVPIEFRRCAGNSRFNSFDVGRANRDGVTARHYWVARARQHEWWGGQL